MTQQQIYIRSPNGLLDALRNQETSAAANYLERNAQQMASILFGDVATSIEDLSALTHILRHGDDDSKTTYRNFIQARLEAHRQSVISKKTPASKTAVQATPLWDRIKKLSWPVKVGVPLSAVALTGFATVGISQWDQNEAPQPSPQDIASTAQEFEGAASPQIEEEIINTNESTITAQPQTTVEEPKSTIREPFQIAVEAYNQSSTAVQVAFPESYYNPFLIKQLETDANARQYMIWITEAALENNLNPVHFANQIFRESRQFDPQIVNCHETSSAGAVGISQIMPSTGKEYGFSYKDLCDPKKAIYAATVIMSDFMQKNNSDPTLSRAAYNGGQGSVALVQKALQRSNITGSDWLTYYEKRRTNAPTSKSGAWQNETYDYVRFISGDGWDLPHQKWAQQQQKNGLPPHMTQVSLIIAEATGQLDTTQINALNGLTNETRRGLAFDSSAPKITKRPEERPSNLGSIQIASLSNI
jgi:soluble lytic murein transglycosylase-like protein